MKKGNLNLHQVLVLLTLSLLFVGPACSKKDDPPSPPSDIWDIDKSGIPKFIGTNFIELDKIYRISKYRSSVGHDYSDASEQCRSMKHYFEPKPDIEWTTVRIYSPVTGIITRVEQEWSGTKIEIASDEYPAFRFSIFHINLSAQRNVDDKVVAGEQLGNHIGSQTMSDISVIVNDPARQGRMVSFFETLKDEAFTEYSNHGIASRQELMISKELRDANPLTCNGDVFMTTDILENWVIVH
jgi:hypothetical protein